MSAVVLTAIVAWLVLCALTTVAWTLVARGGLREDQRRRRLLMKAERERESAMPPPHGSRR